MFLVLCFSGKEALYKCVAPIVGQFFDFLEVEVVALDFQSRLLAIRLLRNLGPGYPHGHVLEGRFEIGARHVFTSFTVPAALR